MHVCISDICMCTFISFYTGLFSIDEQKQLLVVAAKYVYIREHSFV